MMEQQIFVDENGISLIVKYRKSAVFFLKKYSDSDLRDHRCGETYIDGDGLEWRYDFTAEVFKEFIDFLNVIATKCWASFEVKEADSLGAEYDDYYDREFDNNGKLRINNNGITIGGPYAQPPNKEKLTRLIKFNKRKFESFIFDLNKKMEG